MRKTTNPSAELLTIPEAAAEFKLSTRTLRRYLASGRLKSVRVGRRVYCTRQDVRNAAVDGLASVEANHMVDDAWRERTVREWLQMVRGFMGSIVSSTRPIDARARYLEEITARFGDLKVSEYRLRHVEEVHRIAKSQGWWLEDAEMLLVLPKELPVIDALREVQARFAGIVPTSRDGVPRSTRTRQSPVERSPSSKPSRPPRATSRRDADRWSVD